MTSELKSATARANGAKSRGPKTPETREKSSRNAITHGYTSRKTMVLECECDEDFQEMIAYYTATYQPGSAVESTLVDEMVAARWRMLRLRMIEAALFDSEMRREPSPNDPQPKPTDPGYQLADAFRRLVDDSRALSLASRYESRLHRMHERSHRTLRELQQSRKEQEQAAEPVAPPQPQPEPQAQPDPASWGGAMRCPPAQAAEPITHPAKKSQNEPKPATSRAALKHIQRRAAIGHFGIARYIGYQNVRYLKRFKTAPAPAR